MQYLGLLSLILMVFIFFFFAKSIIAKQFEDSRIKHMCIFHMLTVRGLPSEGASVPSMGLPGNAEAPWLHACSGRASA